jgi:anthranilate/para-aminobenzoate synthase component I
MIVDLMRSDLGKNCSIGSVKTTKLFKVEKYLTVHQMTSTVQGTLSPAMTCGEVLKNLFPSGSVTGAPKINSIEIIHELESGERGVYCGAIGFIDPFGSAVFSVPIRTLLHFPPSPSMSAIRLCSIKRQRGHGFTMRRSSSRNAVSSTSFLKIPKVK